MGFMRRRMFVNKLSVSILAMEGDLPFVAAMTKLQNQLHDSSSSASANMCVLLEP